MSPFKQHYMQMHCFKTCHEATVYMKSEFFSVYGTVPNHHFKPAQGAIFWTAENTVIFDNNYFLNLVPSSEQYTHCLPRSMKVYCAFRNIDKLNVWLQNFLSGYDQHCVTRNNSLYTKNMTYKVIWKQTQSKSTAPMILAITVYLPHFIWTNVRKLLNRETFCINLRK